MRFLLDHGAEVDAPMKFGIIPLWEARQNDQDEAEKLLITHGVGPMDLTPPRVLVVVQV